MKKIIALLCVAVVTLVLPDTGPAEPRENSDLTRPGLAIRSVITNLAQPGGAFQLSNFISTPAKDGAMAAWRVDLKVTKAIAADTYALQSHFVDNRGERLLAGEDIVLPAGTAGKVFTLTRSYEAQPAIAGVVLTLVDRAQGMTMVEHSYPLTAAAPSPAGASRGFAKPGVPQQVAGSAPPLDLELRYSLRAFSEKSSSKVCLKNESALAVKVDPAWLIYDFAVGVDGKYPASFSGRNLEPGGEVCAELSERIIACPTLQHIDLTMHLNGNPFHERIFTYELLLQPIDVSPEVSFQTRWAADIDDRDANVNVYVVYDGNFVRPEGVVILKGEAEIDGSSRFPVNITMSQGERSLGGWGQINSTRKRRPQSFCINLLEIITDDSLLCGGVGVNLFRHKGGDFLFEKNCM
ncbi:hypothetical protein ACHHRT_05090 [Desulfurivibrio sp. D14AmB]|uniref:hypothetical protein n=1 Tax=Desulfurivibrio sp. D14AmB TaxID=3374370 RepID=UPI00376EF8D2